MEKLEELLKRVRKATGPSKKLDNLIHDAMIEPLIDLKDVRTPYYSDSIDAALALVGEMLPGWHLVDCSQDDSGWALELRSADQSFSGYQRHSGTAKTFPLAILAALLTALIEEKSDE